MFNLITQGCNDLETAGVKINQTANLADVKTDSGKQGEGDCRHGNSCYSKWCTRKHPDGREKGRKKKPGQGGLQQQDGKVCQAAKCKAASKKFRFCATCHRKGIEGSGYVTTKDGQKIAVGDKANQNKDCGFTGKQQRGLSALMQATVQATKRALAVQEDGDDSDEHDEEECIPGPAGPKSKKQKRAAAATAKSKDTKRLRQMDAFVGRVLSGEQ